MRPRSQFQFPFGQLALLSASSSSYPSLCLMEWRMRGKADWQGWSTTTKFMVWQVYGMTESSGNASYSDSSGCSSFLCDHHFMLFPTEIYFGLFLLTGRLDHFHPSSLPPEWFPGTQLVPLFFCLLEVLHIWFLTFSALGFVTQKKSANNN